jgi:hypothetical protein
MRRRRAPEDTPISVEEATTRHTGKWVLMEITSYDEYRSPAWGVVRLASRSRRRITDESLVVRDAMRESGEFRALFIFYADTNELGALESALAATRWDIKNGAGGAGSNG